MGPRVKESDKASNRPHRLRVRLTVRKLPPLVDIEDLNMDQLSSRLQNNVDLIVKRHQLLRPRIRFIRQQLVRLQGNVDHFIKRASPEFQNKVEQLMRAQKEAAAVKIDIDEKVNAAKQDVMEELVKKMELELAFSEPEEKLAIEMHKMSLY